MQQFIQDALVCARQVAREAARFRTPAARRENVFHPMRVAFDRCRRQQVRREHTHGWLTHVYVDGVRYAGIRSFDVCREGAV